VRLFLGLDGGGTGCRAVLADAAGTVRGRGQGGPANVMSDPDGAVAAITDCLAQAVGDHDPAQIHAVLGLAGVNTSGAAEWLPARLGLGQVRVVQDAVTAAAGALGDADGIVAAMGTGSVFIRQLDGQVTTRGGWGPILGDEGSGNWLGRRFLADVLRAEDGFLPQTPLTRQTLDRHGGASGIVGFARTATGAAFGAEVPHLLQFPDDPAALRLWDAACACVAGYIDALQTDLGLPVVFSGGLGPVYARLLADRWQIRAPLGTPLDGALRLALAL